jgi:diaminopimelate epimerase
VASAGAGPGRWRVDVPGGELEVSRDEEGRVYLTGPALIVARGETDL